VTGSDKKPDILEKSDCLQRQDTFQVTLLLLLLQDKKTFIVTTRLKEIADK